MSYASIHPAWDHPPEYFLEGSSLEATTKEAESLRDAAHLIPQGAPIAIPYLATDDTDARVRATKTVKSLGFQPMPHLSARRIKSVEELRETVRRCVEEGQANRVLLVAGDPPMPEGPFEDTMQILQTGILEEYGLKAVGIGGHPDGHPAIADEVLWKFMKLKVDEIKSRGMAPLIVTQFGFDAQSVLEWLLELRHRGFDVPVRIGVPGPASIKRLLKFAKICGVGSSVAVLKKYGISLARLIDHAGPDKLIDALREQITEEHGRVRIHFYPFGGIEPTMRWIKKYSEAELAQRV